MKHAKSRNKSGPSTAFRQRTMEEIFGASSAGTREREPRGRPPGVGDGKKGTAERTQEPVDGKNDPGEREEKLGECNLEPVDGKNDPGEREEKLGECKKSKKKRGDRKKQPSDESLPPVRRSARTPVLVRRQIVPSDESDSSSSDVSSDEWQPFANGKSTILFIVLSCFMCLLVKTKESCVCFVDLLLTDTGYTINNQTDQMHICLQNNV